MAGHLLGAGRTVTMFDRTKSRADDLVAGGARRPDSPAAPDTARFDSLCS